MRIRLMVFMVLVFPAIASAQYTTETIRSGGVRLNHYYDTDQSGTSITLNETGVLLPTGQFLWSALVGYVTGPGSSTDNAIARFDGTGGKTIQNSSVTIDDSGDVDTNGDIEAFGDIVAGSDVTAFATVTGLGDVVSSGGLNVAEETNLGSEAGGAFNWNAPQADFDATFSAIGRAGALVIQGSEGNVGVGTTTPTARLSILTVWNEALEAMKIEQRDTDAPFIDFVGTVGNDLNLDEEGNGADSGGDTVVAPNSTTWAHEGMIKIERNGATMYIPYFSKL